MLSFYITTSPEVTSSKHTQTERTILQGLELGFGARMPYVLTPKLSQRVMLFAKCSTEFFLIDHQTNTSLAQLTSNASAPFYKGNNMLLRKHYAVRILFPWRHSEGHHEGCCISTAVFVNVFESLSVPGKFNIWLKKEILSYLQRGPTASVKQNAKTMLSQLLEDCTNAFQGHKKEQQSSDKVEP